MKLLNYVLFRSGLLYCYSFREANFISIVYFVSVHEQVSLLSKEQVNNIDKTDSPEQIDPSAHKNAKKCEFNALV